EDMGETRADMTVEGVTFIRFFRKSQTQGFSLSAEEAEDFAMAWLSFSSMRYELEQAEIRRIEQVKQQAFAISATCPVILIEVNDARFWKVSVLEIKFSRFAYGPDELLIQVQNAKEAYDEHERIKLEVEKAFTIASKAEGMSITSRAEVW